MLERQKEVILNTYDDYCDTLPHVSKLYANLGVVQQAMVKYALQKTKVPFGAHAKIKNWIIKKANKNIFIPMDKGLGYIDNPGVEVETTLPGQDKPGSLENNVFIATLHEHYFELEDTEDVRYEIDKNLIGYLDKGLIKLALRVRKVLVAPGVYKAVTEVVPVYTSVYNEMLDKLILDFKLKYNKVPTEETLSLLKSKAMSAVCDREYSNGFIEQVDSMHRMYATKLDSVIQNPNSRLIVNWTKFKREIEREYCIAWDDVLYSRQGKEVNIWGKGTPVAFDNRALVKEQPKLR